MDGILVSISLIDAFVALVAPSNSPKIFGVLRVFRLLRSLRPLRYSQNSCIEIMIQYSEILCAVELYVTGFSSVINRAPGLKLVVETLLTSLRPIGNIVLISAIFFLIFGILGVQVSGESCKAL